MSAKLLQHVSPSEHSQIDNAHNGRHVDKRVIIHVDDYAPFLGAISNLLEDEFEVIPLLNPNQCLRNIHESSPCLVLLDVEMPTMNGIDLCKKIRAEENYRDIPIIIYTSHLSSGLRKRAYSAGATLVLGKSEGVAAFKQGIALACSSHCSNN